MSLLPILINDLLDDYRRPFVGNVYDQNFGMELFNDETLQPLSSLMSVPIRCGYLRPWRHIAANDSGVSTVESNNDEFKINLDVQQFKPEELKVKLVDDCLVIDGKHEERSDQHGFISRQFTRRYKLPDDVNKAAIVSNLSSDGVLTLKAPKMALPEKSGRDIPINQASTSAIKEKKEPSKPHKGTKKTQSGKKMDKMEE